MRDEDQKGSNERKSRSRSRSNSSKASKKSEKSNSSYSKSRSRSRSHSRDKEDGFRLHIADIGDDVRKSDLEKYFSQFGPLKEIWMTNSSPCFGFAVFKEKKAAADAINEADGAEICGSRIHVTYAKPRTRGSGRSFFNPNMRCYQCSYTGHFYRDCPELNGGEKRGGGGRYDSGHYERYDRRNSHRNHRERESYYGYERNYNRNRHDNRRRERRYDDHDSYNRRSSRRHRY